MSHSNALTKTEQWSVYEGLQTCKLCKDCSLSRTEALESNLLVKCWITELTSRIYREVQDDHQWTTDQRGAPAVGKADM